MSTAFSEAWLTGPGDIDFYTRTYTPTTTKAVLVFVHGFIEHIARYEHVFPSYAKRGIAVFAFDQRGFGRTALNPGEDGNRQKGRISRGEGYARTSSEQQKLDIDWALGHAGKELAGFGKDGPALPLFLMGHSMGGSLVLSFGTSPPLHSLHKLSGVIATSPLIAQTRPTSKFLRSFGSIVGLVSPWTTVPAGIKAEDLCHDKQVAEAYINDPLVQQYGTLRGVSTMLNLGGYLSTQEYKSWPSDLPVLLIHGEYDQITSHAATENFYNNIRAGDKTFSSYKNGFHELHNEPQLKQRLVDEVISWIEKHVPQETNFIPRTPDAKL